MHVCYASTKTTLLSGIIDESKRLSTPRNIGLDYIFKIIPVNIDHKVKSPKMGEPNIGSRTKSARHSILLCVCQK